MIPWGSKPVLAKSLPAIQLPVNVINIYTLVLPNLSRTYPMLKLAIPALICPLVLLVCWCLWLPIRQGQWR